MRRHATTTMRPAAATHGHFFAVACLLLLSLLHTGCVSTGPSRSVASLAPLQLGAETLTVDDVGHRIHTPNLLFTDQSMVDFVALYTEGPDA